MKSWRLLPGCQERVHEVFEALEFVDLKSTSAMVRPSWGSTCQTIASMDMGAFPLGSAN